MDHADTQERLTITLTNTGTCPCGFKTHGDEQKQMSPRRLSGSHEAF